jgi:2-oxoglutarate dehydrogenase E2 component (dihydrolipoamide succinyltransferase)
VVVPSLGESITDGTIASVLKGAGDPVKENETIAQIETDKVTIDIKAPSDGTILGIVVQEQETVVPGQLVATLDDAAAKANLIGATPPAAASYQTHATAPASAAASAAHPAPSHRTPGIRFPPRVTADGKRVSALPAAEAQVVIQQWRSEAAAATPQTAAGGTSHSATPAAKHPDAADSLSKGAKPAAAAEAAALAAAAPSKSATGVRQLDKMPPRRELTEKEMELIELGGAA